MAPKPKKASTSYSPKPMGLYEQGQTSRASAKKQADKVTAKRLKATSYAPSAMTDKQKKAAALKGAKKQAGIGIKKDLTKIAGAAGKVAKRVKTVRREARDVYTAVGSAAQALRKSPQDGMPVKATVKNVAKQVKEVGRAAVTGKKGTTAYKVKPDPRSQEKRKAAGGKGFVFYDVTKPKKR